MHIYICTHYIFVVIETYARLCERRVCARVCHAWPQSRFARCAGGVSSKFGTGTLQGRVCQRSLLNDTHRRGAGTAATAAAAAAQSECRNLPTAQINVDQFETGIEMGFMARPGGVRRGSATRTERGVGTGSLGRLKIARGSLDSSLRPWRACAHSYSRIACLGRFLMKGCLVMRGGCRGALHSTSVLRIHKIPKLSVCDLAHSASP
jgi:hypothetical protein